MKIFPKKSFIIEFSNDRVVTINKLLDNTEISESLVSKHTNKEFIGEIYDDGFKIISSEIGRGALCVFIGELQDSYGNLEIRIHKAFKIMFSILVLMHFIALGIIIFTNGFENLVKMIVSLIISILLIRFVFLEFSFRKTSKIGINKLDKIIGIKVFKEI